MEWSGSTYGPWNARSSLKPCARPKHQSTAPLRTYDIINHWIKRSFLLILCSSAGDALLSLSKRFKNTLNIPERIKLLIFWRDLNMGPTILVQIVEEFRFVINQLADEKFMRRRDVKHVRPTRVAVECWELINFMCFQYHNTYVQLTPSTGWVVC